MPKVLGPDSIVQRVSDIVSAEVEQELVMVSIENGSYYSMSDVGRHIWEAIESPKKVSNLVEDLTLEYDIDVCSCTKQTLGFLENLLSEHLLLVIDE